MTPAFVSPVSPSWRISAGFGDWGTYWTPKQTSGPHAGQGQHEGTDFAVPVGTEVCAIAAGVVKEVSTTTLSGLGILIDHRTGFTSSYRHLSQALVSVGQTVAQGERIALSGRSGTSATGAHLHLGVRDLLAAGAPMVDPRPFVTGSTVTSALEDLTVTPAGAGAFLVSASGLTSGMIVAGVAIAAAVLLLGKKD